MKETCCAFTGHRPKSFPWKNNEIDYRCVLLKEVLAEQIRGLQAKGVTDWLSGMAEGVDLWAAEIVLALREKNPVLKLHCVLPHKGQAEKWSLLAQEKYHSILKQADSITYISREFYNGCMLDRNHYLVDHTAYLLAVYSGVRRSGTGATVNYARKLGREIIIIDPITRQVTLENQPPSPPKL